MRKSSGCFFIFFLSLLLPVAVCAYEGKIKDAETGLAIEAAVVSIGETAVRTDKQGFFRLDGEGEKLKIKAAGYKKREIPTSGLEDTAVEIGLTPFSVKALYLTVYGAASSKLRNAALETIENNGLNALVIDVKGDRGFIPFKVDLPLAQDIGAQNTILIKDIKALVSKLKEKNLYLIARIVVFKDDTLAKAEPELAVRKKGGGFYRDRERLRWVDPFIPQVWDYNIAIAKAVAEFGFDEIQFDYVRFPDTRRGIFVERATEENRTWAITRFLENAYHELTPYNVTVSADIFGYVAWNTNDTDIGQKIVPITQAVDVVSPMLYPSGYHLGIPKYRNPVQHPYQIVYQSLKQAQERTGVSPLRYRPWLQAFRDYAFRGGDFKEQRMHTQIQAAEDFGASGWMFWNPRNVYPKGVFNDTR